MLGAGPVGVELITELAHTFREYAHFNFELRNSSDQVLRGYPERARSVVRERLRALRINFVVEHCEGAPQNRPGEIVFDCRGNQYKCGFFSAAPFADCLDAQQRILVDEGFRVRGLENLYAIGDCCVSPHGEAKMSYNAMLQGWIVSEHLKLKNPGQSSRR